MKKITFSGIATVLFLLASPATYSSISATAITTKPMSKCESSFSKSFETIDPLRILPSLALHSLPNKTFGTIKKTNARIKNDSAESGYKTLLGGEINIKGNFSDISDGSLITSQTSHTDFGSVSIGSGSVTVTYTIENTGSGALNVGAITFSGTNASDFTLLAAPVSSVPAGETTSFKIGFNPTVLGIKNATVNIVSDDSDENPYNFAISGLGVQTYSDTDQDGITDNFDIDDDNDGILDIIEQTNCLISPFASTVQYTFLNETFGSGTTKGLININIPGATCTYCYEDGIEGTDTAECPFQSSKILDDGEYCVNYKITGATATDPENIHGDLAWYDGPDHTPNDTNGRMAIFNASFAAGTFYETTITGVIPNVPITYSFWTLNIMSQSKFPTSILPNITVEFTDLSNTVLSTFNTGDLGRCSSSVTDNTCATGIWQQFITTVNLGNVTDFIIRFKNNADGGGGNDLALDDINIVQQYCDSDGDGVANLFDLDDENDGIPDIEEAGFKIYSNGMATMDKSALTWSDINLNGLNDALDLLIAGGSYTIPDTDGDGVPDYLDLDSDNDSYFDVDEAGLLNGDGDINGDGKGDLADSDRDGILDLYDNHTGFGTTARAYAQNTDGSGNPDYLDPDADDDGKFDIQNGLYADLDGNNDGTIDIDTDTDKDGIADIFDTNDAAIGSPRDLDNKLFLEFDGRNDYGQGTAVLGGMANATLMAWIDLNNGFSGIGTIVGQDQFKLRVTSDKKLEVVLNGTSLQYNATALNTAQWYHAGVVYGNGFLKLYLNGAMVASTAVSGNINADASLLTIGKDPTANTNYFKGKIDEIRLFDVALTDEQLQRMVYQEIQDSGSEVRGAVIPRDIGGLPYANLIRYYRMDAYKDDIIDDLTTSGIDAGSGMRIYNNKNIQFQQAPMPFTTIQSGDFATAVNDPDSDIRGLDIMDQDWSIVKVNHNIEENSNTVDLGMLVFSEVNVVMNNDTKIQNDWYLKLDGKIDLQGKSQLVQTINSELEVTSAGAIERDQKGQSNKFNYNYWSSPVGDASTTTNNNTFTVNTVMRDATDSANLLHMNWTSGYDGSATVPITLSNYWIFKFQNLSPLYANWAYTGPDGVLLPAQGFTLKGSSASGLFQNYAFTGKPHNGAISSPIAANNANLSGNPYASALDANAFITANTTSTTGAIYFWEHYDTNSSHNLLEYQAGYAVRTLVGGLPAVAPPLVSGLGSSTRIPGRYIPVGQGFFVVGNETGGNINFDNSQRAFVKEDHAESNILFRESTDPAIGQQYNNLEDVILEDDDFAKIRLGFDFVNGFHRQLLLGFMDENCTDAYDPGYDALQIETNPDEIVFINGEHNLIIQGVGYFNENNRYPLGIKTNTSGTVRFVLDGTENFNPDQKIYIYDALTEEYHDIRTSNFEIDLAAGIINDRFSLRFQNNLLAVNNFEAENIVVKFTNNDNVIHINNKVTDATIKSVTLFNILGQTINSWDVKGEDQKKIQIPVKNLSAGTYIVKVLTTKGAISKKIIIK